MVNNIGAPSSGELRFRMRPAITRVRHRQHRQSLELSFADHNAALTRDPISQAISSKGAAEMSTAILGLRPRYALPPSLSWISFQMRPAVNGSSHGSMCRELNAAATALPITPATGII